MFSQLGDIIFNGAFSPSGSELTSSATYAEHALILGKPRLQRTGVGLKDIKLSIKLHRNFCTPEDEIAKIQSYIDEGASLRYVSGTGALIGNFVITSAKQADAAMGPEGKIIETDIELSLLENYIQDTKTSEAVNAIEIGFAMSNNLPLERLPIIESFTPITVATASVTEINSRLARLILLVQNAVGTAQNIANQVRAALAEAREMKQRAEEAIAAVNSTIQDVYDATREFEDQCNEIKDSIDGFVDAIQTGSIADAIDAIIPISNNNVALLSSAETLERLNGARLPIPFVNG